MKSLLRVALCAGVLWVSLHTSVLAGSRLVHTEVSAAGGKHGLGASVTPADTGVHRLAQSVSIQAGVLGVRGFYNRSVGHSGRFMMRVGGQYLAYRKPNRVNLDKNAYIMLQPDFMVGLAELGARWQVFKGRSLYVATSLAYNWHPSLSLRIHAEDKLNFDGLELTPEDVGIVDLGFKWQQVMPYAGVGLGKVAPKRKLSVGGEVGFFYMGKPRVALDYTGFLETTTIDEQIPIVERNLSGYRFLPTLTVSLTYRLP
ncbi:hypothetical protein F5984_16310 [Rudanella paleaurantiibacter]|uniref:Outer membrane beta-barrel protein n=1 Tax=Rudanella paleaurantiibacter TaxID=2614655 RepID=A0A7J5TX90_9BACT|nr:hypothetical protein [Rudanella paleaurantiibacter]KAB7729201.1 hypothetical protein F5984_16310 [Rudanella paleaurantiibacter]